MSITQKPRHKFDTRIVRVEPDAVVCEFTRSELDAPQIAPIVIANVKFLDLSRLIARNKERIATAKSKNDTNKRST